MVGIVFELKDLKWIVRLSLILFFIGGIIAHVYGMNFFGWLIKDHITTTLFVTFLTGISFLGFFVPKPKTRDAYGGEKVMRKFYIAIIIVLSLLMVLAVAMYFYTDQTKAAIGGIGLGIGATVVGVGEAYNGFLAGFAPYMVQISGIIMGVLIAVFLANWLIPRAKARWGKTTTIPIGQKSAPDIVPGAVITQPARPTITTPIIKEEQEATA